MAKHVGGPRTSTFGRASLAIFFFCSKLLWPLNFKSWELFEAETGAKKIGHDILLFMLPSSIMFFMQNWAT